MTMQLPFRSNRQVCLDFLIAFARFIRSVRAVDRSDLLTRFALLIYTCCDGDEEFEYLLDVILAAEDSQVGLEVESRVWQSVSRPLPDGRIAAGSQAWFPD